MTFCNPGPIAAAWLFN